MTAPPPYPRIPHLAAGRGTGDDLVLGPEQVAGLLAAPVVVAEKLDGANVVVWEEDGRLECALRSGPGAMDRAGQLGPLRAWLGEHDEAVRAAAGGGVALYAEWLLLTHSTPYQRLPSYLVVLDHWHPETGFAAVEERNGTCRRAGLAVPPEVWRGVPGDLAAVEALAGPSAWSDEQVEGLVVRRLDPGGPRLAKILRPGFTRADDATWAGGRRPRNRLAGREASWR